MESVKHEVAEPKVISSQVQEEQGCASHLAARLQENHMWMSILNNQNLVF
jgi:hypothetical protein